MASLRWQNRPDPPQEPRMPEPTLLYALVCLAMLVHRATQPAPLIEGQTRTCAGCGQPWPCDQALLAFRLREGF
jgi:hypothetical protein